MKHTVTVNDVLAFLLEMAALVLLGMWARGLPKVSVWRWPAVLLAAGAFIALWALFFARTANHRLPMPWLAVGKLLMLMPAGLLYWRGQMVPSLLWAILVLGHLAWGWVKGGL